MKKELEALERVIKFIDDNGGMTLVEQNDIHIIKKTLIPPTVSEVCKALSEFDDFDKVEYDEQTKTFSSGEIICYIGYDFSSDKCKTTIIFNYDLPPHLITLIGRFYEAQDV